MKKLIMMACALLLLIGNLQAQTNVVAHRGYWNCAGSAQNSLAAMYEASRAGAWGSEFDVHITADGVVIVNHDDDIHGVVIENATYAQIKDMKLANGETLPTLRDYLNAGKKLDGLHLVLEIKEHASKVREDSCVAEAVREVHETGMEARVDYISFSLRACEQVLKRDPNASVYYLNGELSPAEIKAKGFAGLDYDGAVLLKRPEWIAEAHRLGLKVNVWTIDEVRDLQKCVDAKVDYVTTNKPVEALKIASGKLKY